MFSDTHFHFEHTTDLNQKENLENGSEILSKMAERDCFFGLDIGTECDDLIHREECVENSIMQIKDSALQEKARSFLWFSAGIWPGIDDIKNRRQRFNILKQNIALSEAKNDGSLHRKIIALGEFGLDHHWNPNGADGRCESDFDKEIYDGEKELMMMQLEYAKELGIPAIIHSRDAFEDTLDCIKEVGYHKGIIHCYSYGEKEARAFLDLGWHISFSGSVTYTKKSKAEEMNALIRTVPDEKILCETDSPYLSPVPFRGKINSPVNVEHTYRFIANIRGISCEELSEIVDGNIKTLFNLTE